MATEGAAPVKTPKRKTPKPMSRNNATDANRSLPDRIAPLIEKLREAQDQARALDIFPNHRELLVCPKCGLSEDVLADGRLITFREPNYEDDTRLRFIEPRPAGDSFICPECGDEAREDETGIPSWEEDLPPPWESATTLGVPLATADTVQVVRFCAALRASDRVNTSTKKLSDDELLLRNYGLISGTLLTNLGVLLVGGPSDRKRVGPVVRAIKHEDERTVVRRWDWADHQLSVLELPGAVWKDVSVFREFYEVPDGMRRTQVPAFDERVVRELLISALVHLSYSQPGEIVLSLYPDRLELLSPGGLANVVTPKNILQARRRRNEGLARVFTDLGLMDGDGSGVDVVLERMLATGRDLPTFDETDGGVRVAVPREIAYPAIRHFITEVDRRHHLTSRERLVLALVLHGNDVSAEHLAAGLVLSDLRALPKWLGRLVKLGIIERVGPGESARYVAAPSLMHELGVGYRPRTIR
jgi:ATP-dependent DNA helicase RecG